MCAVLTSDTYFGNLLFCCNSRLQGSRTTTVIFPSHACVQNFTIDSDFVQEVKLCTYSFQLNAKTKECEHPRV